MSYPTPTDHRFSLSTDGSKLYILPATTNVLSDVSSNLVYIDDEDSADNVAFSMSYTNTTDLIVLFPEARNITAYSIWSGGAASTSNLGYSTDTTNGQDGSWNWQGSGFANQGSAAGLRNLTPLNWQNVKGVRFRYYDSGSSTTVSIYSLHLFGTRVAGPPGLAIWHPTLDQRIDPAALDLGDVSQGTVKTFQFRVKNNHATQSAQGINVDAVTASGAMTLDYSPDGSTYSRPLAISDLAPGAISPVLTARRSTPSNEATGPQWTRLVATASTWA